VYGFLLPCSMVVELSLIFGIARVLITCLHYPDLNCSFCVLHESVVSPHRILSLSLSLSSYLHLQHNSDLKAAAACAPHELELPIALRLGRDISAQLAAVRGDLDLFNKRVGDAGIATIAEHLASNAAVTSLDLYGNRLTDAGAATLGT
jgi:hypothetical protein